ncbi:FAD-dependent monooxygenase [Streptomyces sp. NPDC085932]|uniref:FAD-dependent monooxygenase n=1 Tax=Streptomyces sp. NPDC085932 TaxID=3365741 RepID=UPI0037D6E45F
MARRTSPSNWSKGTTPSSTTTRRKQLLGDAAQEHSAIGGPGLDLGLQDAFNLGRKLAATVRGWAPESLLDTYDEERRPVAEHVVSSTQSQSARLHPGPEVGALRTAHLLAGTAEGFAPDLVIDTAAGACRLAESTHTVRPLLPEGTNATGVLLRPDCHMAWTGTEPGDVSGLRAALHQRFGEPLVRRP